MGAGHRGRSAKGELGLKPDDSDAALLRTSGLFQLVPPGVESPVVLNWNLQPLSRRSRADSEEIRGAEDEGEGEY